LGWKFWDERPERVEKGRGKGQGESRGKVEERGQGDKLRKGTKRGGWGWGEGLEGKVKERGWGEGARRKTQEGSGKGLKRMVGKVQERGPGVKRKTRRNLGSWEGRLRKKTGKEECSTEKSRIIRKKKPKEWKLRRKDAVDKVTYHLRGVVIGLIFLVVTKDGVDVRIHGEVVRREV
jgi:hypothetical protein